MLLASTLGFLALVAPAQIFYALSFDPQRDMQSNDDYKSFIIQGNIYQCLINTYYAALFVFCFASSSIFRDEISKLFKKNNDRAKQNLTVCGNVELFSLNEKRLLLEQSHISVLSCSNSSQSNEFRRKNQCRTVNQ